MAAGNTVDTRTHVMGDMLMMTGTFTDGGKEVDYGSVMDTVFAAGGHLTSGVFSGVQINAGGNEAIGQTVLTCDTTNVAGDCRSCLNVGQTLYTSAAARLGIITAVTATEVTIDTALTAQLNDNTKLYVMGASSMALKADAAVSSHDVALDVSVDETNKLVIFSTGNESSATDAATSDGRWWILGQR